MTRRDDIAQIIAKWCEESEEEFLPNVLANRIEDYLHKQANTPRSDDGLRESVRWFAGQMEARLREHDDRRGWKDLPGTYLITRLDACADELCEAVGIGAKNLVIKTAGDVANFCMMIADNIRVTLAPSPGPPPQPEAAPVAQTEKDFRKLIDESKDDPDYQREKAELAAPVAKTRRWRCKRCTMSFKAGNRLKQGNGEMWHIVKGRICGPLVREMEEVSEGGEG
jgi:hypothetical protein